MCRRQQRETPIFWYSTPDTCILHVWIRWRRRQRKCFTFGCTDFDYCMAFVHVDTSPQCNGKCASLVCMRHSRLSSFSCSISAAGKLARISFRPKLHFFYTYLLLIQIFSMNAWAYLIAIKFYGRNLYTGGNAKAAGCRHLWHSRNDVKNFAAQTAELKNIPDDLVQAKIKGSLSLRPKVRGDEWISFANNWNDFLSFGMVLIVTQFSSVAPAMVHPLSLGCAQCRKILHVIAELNHKKYIKHGDVIVRDSTP